ncbi:type II toxin-antitoxin system ParD family antitoxin [Rhizobium wenxiniae]|nr:type II toxin-antitoxin system ParD family antitoxin [Rhizobium wenxiniae]
MTGIHLSDEHQAFIDKLVKAGFYKDANAIVAGALRLLQQKDDEFFELQRLIQEGIDDVEAGRVHRYESAEDMLSDIQKMSATKKTGTRY